MDKSEVDLVAVSRISRRVELRKIHLTDLTVSCVPGASHKPPLHPSYEYQCLPVKVEGDKIEIRCSYKFTVSSSNNELANVNMTYYIFYKLSGDEPTDEGDIEHFAHANGAYHSWPFVRELIFSLTARMGFQPYTLPVLLFLPRPKPPKPAPSVSVEVTASDSDNGEAKPSADTGHEAGRSETSDTANE